MNAKRIHGVEDSRIQGVVGSSQTGVPYPGYDVVILACPESFFAHRRTLDPPLAEE
jgi:hypothetical protein